MGFSTDFRLWEALPDRSHQQQISHGRFYGRGGLRGNEREQREKKEAVGRGMNLLYRL